MSFYVMSRNVVHAGTWHLIHMKVSVSTTSLSFFRAFLKDTSRDWRGAKTSILAIVCDPSKKSLDPELRNCPSCNERNFLKRNVCFKCQTPKPVAAGLIPGSYVIPVLSYSWHGDFWGWNTFCTPFSDPPGGPPILPRRTPRA